MMAGEHQDSGFTLVELLITVAIVGVIVPALGSVMLVFFQTADVASVRTDRAHDANLFSTYLQPDLASASSVTVAGSCSNSLTLDWSEAHPLPNGSSSPATTYSAAYTVEAVAGSAGPFVLRRTQQTDGSPVGTQVVMHNLENACDVTFARSGTPALVTVLATPGDASDRAESAPLKLSGVVGGRS